MIAKAPGKLVISGAYAVLEGAPSLIAAVDRYVIADASRPAHFLTPEVIEALPGVPAPWFDASALRDGGQKLGLGSSAAIVVASLAAHLARDGAHLLDTELRDQIFPIALAAHRRAQRGGSGIDVAASCYGGVISAHRTGDGLTVTAVQLPPLIIEVWSSGTPASTSELRSRVRAFKQRDRAGYDRTIDSLSRAASQALRATHDKNPDDFLAALHAQLTGLTQMGDDCGAPIVTAPARSLAGIAQRNDAVFLPAGAGGGDVSLYVGQRASTAAFRAEAARLSQRLVSLALGARGVHLEPGR